MRPDSATHWGTVLAGLVALLGGLLALSVVRPFGFNAAASTVFLLCLVGGVMALGDWLHQASCRWPGVKRRSSSSPGAVFRVVLVKFLGLVASILFVAFLYWLLPEYHGTFYSRYWYFLAWLIPAWLILAIPFFWFVESRQVHDDCGYYVFGSFLLALSFDQERLCQVGRHLRAWLVRGFFGPLMFTYLCDAVGRYLSPGWHLAGDLRGAVVQLVDLLYFVDLGMATAAYFVASRYLGNHVRSTDGTGAGWAVALMCYQPFWSLLGRLYFSYHGPAEWFAFVDGSQLFLVVWGSCIVALTFVYAWATAVFGLRFSNLSNKGVITGGPYRWVAHPAYWSKNLSWWLLSVPWFGHASASEAVRHCLLLLAVNGIYALRAWTEARHMRQDPAYRAYEAWLAQHGLASFVRRVFARRFVAGVAA